MCFTSRVWATQHSETIQTFTLLSREICLSHQLRFLPCNLGISMPAWEIHENQMCVAAVGFHPGSKVLGRCPKQDRLKIHCPNSPSVLTGTMKG